MSVPAAAAAAAVVGAVAAVGAEVGSHSPDDVEESVGLAEGDVS